MGAEPDRNGGTVHPDPSEGLAADGSPRDDGGTAETTPDRRRTVGSDPRDRTQGVV